MLYIWEFTSVQNSLQLFDKLEVVGITLYKKLLGSKILTLHDIYKQVVDLIKKLSYAWKVYIFLLL